MSHVDGIRMRGHQGQVHEGHVGDAMAGSRGCRRHRRDTKNHRSVWHFPSDSGKLHHTARQTRTLQRDATAKDFQRRQVHPQGGSSGQPGPWLCNEACAIEDDRQDEGASQLLRATDDQELHDARRSRSALQAVIEDEGVTGEIFAPAMMTRLRATPKERLMMIWDRWLRSEVAF